MEKWERSIHAAIPSVRLIRHAGDLTVQMNVKSRLRSPHLRAIGVMASGSAATQSLAFLLTPIITRLYTPAEYSAIAVYVSIASIAAAVAGGRYESAVALPRETPDGERDAVALVQLPILLSLAFASLGMCVVGALGLIGFPSTLQVLGWWSLALPIGVVLGVSTAALSSYATRSRMYRTLARVPAQQKIAGSSTQIAGGLLHLGTAGLVVGAIAGAMSGIWPLFRNFRRGAAVAGVRACRPETQRLKQVARRYSDFPRVSSWFGLLNALASSVQVLVIGQFYDAAEVGQYALAFSTISLPMSLVLAGVSQVYLREAAARVNDRAAAVALASKAIIGLLGVSVPLFATLFIIAKFLLVPLFGPEWSLASSLALAMLPLLWARFLTTSLSSTFNVYRRQGMLLSWQVVALSTTLVVFLTGGNNGMPLTQVTLLVSATTGPLYLLLAPLAYLVLRLGTPEKYSDLNSAGSLETSSPGAGAQGQSWTDDTAGERET